MIFVIFLLLLMTRSLALTCQDDSLKDLKFCDIDLSFEDRVEDLLPRLNLSEKISQFGMVGQAIERLGIREYNFGGEALHGLWSTCYNGTYCPTQFPSPITMASSWNRDAWEDAARASAIEARALYRENLLHYPDGFGDGCSKSLEGCLGLSYYAPNINIGRDPRWGRIEEIPGEDPRFNGEYGTRFVRGFQGNGTYLLASTVVKHFVAYSLEIDIENMNPTEFCGNANCTTPNDRHSFNAIVDEIDLKETYLPAFKDVVQAGAWGVMCSYNAVNGEPMCTNKALIGDTLRSEFGFEGVVATDCGALNDARIHHHRYNTDEETVTAAIRAGTDSNCGSIFTSALPSAMNSSSTNYTGLKESELDVSVKRLLLTRFKLGLFDENNKKASVPKYTLDNVNSKAHQDLALKLARQGIVLLKNENDILPISTVSNMTIAAIGPMANASFNMLGGYHGSTPFLVTPLEAMKETWGNVKYALGCNASGTLTSKQSIEDAVMTASHADMILLGLGLCGNNYAGESAVCPMIQESEGIDRKSLLLSDPQLELFRKVDSLNKPIVLFLMNAGGLDILEMKNSQNVHAIVWSGLGGEFGGRAIVDVLSGIYNPSGALTMTWYPEMYANMTKFHDMSMRGGTPTNPAGRTYRYLNRSIVKPVFEFGFGLSYTKFDVDFVDGNQVVVRNIGHRTGDCVVACYFVSIGSHSLSTKSLIDFTRLENLEPGTEKSVSLSFMDSNHEEGLSDSVRCEVTGGVYVQRQKKIY